MNRILPIAALLTMLPTVPLWAQLKPAELPRLMTARSISSLPAAAPTTIIRYGEAASQQVELFLARTDADNPDALRPVVVTINGGCWQKRHGAELLRPAAGAFLDRGFAVWSIGYRRIDEEGGGYPGTFADVGQALDLLRDHAEANRLDLGRVILFGHASGGHLALWAAGRHKLPASSPLHRDAPLQPRGVVSVGGFGSLKNWEKEIRLACGDQTVPLLAPGETESRFADTSPDMLLPTGVPIVMLHGVFDQVAFPAMGLEHARAARAAGDRAHIYLAPVSGHFEPIAPGTPAFSQALAAVERFSR
ncbi:MAG: alpha/beta hydrolase [Sandarakinorhabdus sp.]|nr:alpha/beta hydrolase [Sandarakinorhabdus sp.]